MSTETMESLLAELKKKDAEIAALKARLSPTMDDLVTDPLTTFDRLQTTKLNNDQIGRYSRQLLLPEIGVRGQLKLARSSVLIVGCGGLGCPAAQYLGAAGVETIGVIDYDTVEVSNLHRQVLHSEDRVGVPKSLSIHHAIRALNSTVRIIPYHIALNSTNALEVIRRFDVVLDATDNVATRYLLNDACVIADKPLVSGSALRFEGQLTVYNYNGGPTYRCLYPDPPPPETVTNCSDGGVLGVIPGIIGCIQALEAIKIICGLEVSYSGKMLLFDGLGGQFRTVRLRPRQTTSKVTELIDYEQFCGAQATDKDEELAILSQEDRISAQELNEKLKSKSHILLDVRTAPEMDICSLPGSINFPITQIDKEETVSELKQLIASQNATEVFVVCRRGNDSQKAVKQLKQTLDGDVVVKDIRGGLHAWAKNVEPEFPVY